MEQTTTNQQIYSNCCHVQQTTTNQQIYSNCCHVEHTTTNQKIYSNCCHVEQTTTNQQIYSNCCHVNRQLLIRRYTVIASHIEQTTTNQQIYSNCLSTMGLSQTNLMTSFFLQMMKQWVVDFEVQVSLVATITKYR